ncbi:sensor histidine kinase [Eubacteriales bacterium OttesenSCG-928-N13]|nr:sensor histidine kinase [Eubacteriales bacterium OttesenSCG-928-N13]
MKRFTITLASILLISFGAFWFISVPHSWQTELFRYTLFGVFLGVAFIMSLYHVFLYVFAERERAYLLFAATCLIMLTRFVTIENGIASLLMTSYPWQLGRISLSLLAAHGIFGIWFMYEALRLSMGKAVLFSFVVCYGISFLGPFVFDRAHYLFIGLIPHVVVITQALRAPDVRKNPYKMTLVAGIALFLVWTVFGVVEVTSTLFMPGLFPWLFFFFTQMVLLTVEFSETRKHGREMADSNVLLENLNRVKSELFSNISHEIKTPLTVIATDISLSERHIQRGEYDEAMQLLDNAHAEVMHTADFVGDALHFARNQESVRKMKNFDFDAVIRTTAAVFEPFAKMRGNVIEILADVPSGPQDALLPVWGTADTLGTAMVNLLTNANNHTEDGKIQILMSVTGAWIHIVVRDNGSGISAEMLPHVFERGVTDGQGTGLGLAIAKAIIEHHGGEIHIESEWGKGTAVRFTLPAVKEVRP